MATPLFPIQAPLAEPPRPGSGSLLTTLGRAAIAGWDGDVPEREVGFTFNPENCGDSGVLDEDACDSTPPSKTISSNESIVEVQGFYAWAGDKCSPFELGRDWQGRARRQLAASLSYQVAFELWTGTVTPNRSLGHDLHSDVLTAGPTGPTDALALLEYALGDCAHGARGVIHATRHAATYWAENNLLRREGNQLLTFLDTIVIADAGYDGSGPYGQAAVDGSQWAYATGMPIVRLGPERVIPEDMAGALNRGANTVEWRAERKAAAGWDSCCHLAVEIDLEWPDILGAGS